MKDKRLTTDLIDGFQVKSVLVGLNLPDSATEFQKSLLFAAHLCALLRDRVLRGLDVDRVLLDDVLKAAEIALSNFDLQR